MYICICQAIASVCIYIYILYYIYIYVYVIIYERSPSVYRRTQEGREPPRPQRVGRAEPKSVSLSKNLSNRFKKPKQSIQKI